MAELTLAQAIQLASQHLQAGRAAEAQALCQEILRVVPQQPDALHYLGVIAGQAGDLATAQRYLHQAIAVDPNRPQFYNNLGSFLQDRGRIDEAIECYRKALAIDPNFAESLNNMGAAVLEQRNFDRAIEYLERALAVRPNYANALNNYGNALREKERYAEALSAYERCVALNPNFAEGQSNLATILFDLRDLPRAVTHFQKALQLRPDFAQAHCNYGTTLRLLNRLDEAVAEYEAALRYDPDLAMAHNNLGVTLLLRGEFERGWREHQWRWLMNPPPSPRRTFSQPEWDGSSLEGRTILLHCEQGLGDSIQFIRYAPLLARRGAKAILESPRALATLFSTVRGVDQIVTAGQVIPPFDVHCSLMSLPLRFKTDLQSIPANVPYLFTLPQDVAMWKSRLNALGSGKRNIGLAWAGNPKQQFDRERSLPLSVLAPLAKLADVRLISLQHGAGAEQAKTAEPGMNLIDWTGEIKNFSDAALIEALDLVITIDTSTAHLAGALGKPVWVLLPYVPDWRWMMGREDSPWYPTMRLFRQSSPGRWDDVVERVIAELK